MFLTRWWISSKYTISLDKKYWITFKSCSSPTYLKSGNIYSSTGCCLAKNTVQLVQLATSASIYFQRLFLSLVFCHCIALFNRATVQTLYCTVQCTVLQYISTKTTSGLTLVYCIYCATTTHTTVHTVRYSIYSMLRSIPTVLSCQSDWVSAKKPDINACVNAGDESA